MPNVMIRKNDSGGLLFYVAKKDMEETIATVEVDTEAGLSYAVALIANDLGRARGHVTWHQVAECRIAALQEVVALVLRNLARRARLVLVLGNPDSPVVA